MSSRVRGIIFDFDGLILDTETPIYHAWRECYEEHGHELPIETFAQCVGTDFADYDPAKELERLIDRELDWKPLNEKRRHRVQQMLDDDPQPMPGVSELLREAAEAGLPCAIASSSPRVWVAPWIERLQLSHHFSHIVTVDDVKRPKPSPELFTRAAERLELAPEQLVVLEDSWNGLLAARAAGIPCVVVPNAITRHFAFEGAAARIGSLEVGLQGLSELLAQE